MIAVKNNGEYCLLDVSANISAVVASWMTFLVLTIAGERLELTRFLPPRPTADKLFVSLLILILVGVGLAATSDSANFRVFSLGLLGLAGQWAGITNAIALLLFVLTLIARVLRDFVVREAKL